jgi:hypothetical protein
VARPLGPLCSVPLRNAPRQKPARCPVGGSRGCVVINGTTPGSDPLLVLKDESHRKPDEAKWKQAVSQALQIYGDRADAYAIWNEPNDNGSVEVDRCGTRIFEWQSRSDPPSPGDLLLERRLDARGDGAPPEPRLLATGRNEGPPPNDTPASTTTPSRRSPRLMRSDRCALGVRPLSPPPPDLCGQLPDGLRLGRALSAVYRLRRARPPRPRTSRAV